MPLFEGRRDQYPYISAGAPARTSQAARDDVAKGRDAYRLAVLERLYLSGPMTADELASAIGKTILYMRPLVCEMAKWCPPLIEDDGTEAINEVSGKAAMRMRCTSIGVQYLAVKKTEGRKQ